MAFILTEVSPQLTLKHDFSSRNKLHFLLKVLALSLLVLWDLTQIPSTLLYLSLLSLLLFNVTYVYLYNFRSISIPQSDTLKVKWLAHLFLAFFSPLLVFISNEQPNYKILRFNSDPHTIILLVVACSGYWYISCIAEAEKKTSDINV